MEKKYTINEDIVVKELKNILDYLWNNLYKQKETTISIVEPTTGIKTSIKLIRD
jgi:hypothetical protein